MTIVLTTIWTPEYLTEVLKGYPHPPTVRYLDWGNADALDELLKIAQNRSGADVSQVGDTWVSGFVGMDALRPFSAREVASLGGREAFLPPFWQMGTRPGADSSTYSIPSTTGSRYILYRRDLLENAGIDPNEAFLTPAQVEQTVEQLRLAGVKIPLVLETRGRELLYRSAAWLRSMGGDYYDAGQRRVVFDSPQAVAGLASFFRLIRSMPPEVRDDQDAWRDKWFVRGQAAVTISGFWLYDLCQKSLPAKEFSAVQVAPPPGIPFVGGAHFVIWKHTTRETEAFNLVRHLCSREAMMLDFQLSGHTTIPSRMDALNAPPFTTEQAFQAARQTLLQGRGFWAWPLSTLIEKRLVTMLDQLSEEVMNSPHESVEDLVVKNVAPLARTLNFTLGSLA